jgi:hypothetical protein
VELNKASASELRKALEAKENTQQITSVSRRRRGQMLVVQFGDGKTFVFPAERLHAHRSDLGLVVEGSPDPNEEEDLPDEDTG